MREDLENGCFWADEIKKLRSQPDERLKMAINALPLPGAFRESSIALRALIREKRKSNEDCERELTFLYGLAALNSFMLPYSERLHEPGFNVFEGIVRGKLTGLRSQCFADDQAASCLHSAKAMVRSTLKSWRL